MSNYLNQNFEYFARKLRISVREKTLLKRTNIVSGSETYFDPSNSKGKTIFTKGSVLRKTPLNGDRSLLNFKATLYVKSRTSRLGSETFIGDETKRGGLGKWFDEENVSTIKSDEFTVKSENIPTDPELYARVKADAKKKFNVYPSAYANAWLVREYKKRGGGYRVGKDDSEGLEEKAGIIGSSSSAGRALQGIGSALTPGNISPLTSPIRSRVYGALIPGGGQGVLSRLKPNRKRQARCPAGFEFGGRFTDNRFSTCGAQLFEIPGPLELIRRAMRPTAAPKLPQARAENLSEVLEGNPSNARTIQISRMAQIPRTGAFQKDKFNASVRQSISTLKGAPAGEGRMIRRDGVVLRPVVPSSVLRSFSENPDMVDGAMVRAIQLPADIGADDLALLGGPSMSKIAFVAPNGVTVSIERSRPFTIGEKRKFPRMINSLAESSTKDNIIKNIEDFAKNSDGAFKFIADTGSIPDALALVEYTGADGVKRTAPRWLYETFIKPDLVKQRKKK